MKVVHEQEDSLPTTPITTSSRRGTSSSSAVWNNNSADRTSNNGGGSSSSGAIGGGDGIESVDTIEKLLKQYHNDIQRLGKVRAADHQLLLQQEMANDPDGDHGTVHSGYSSSINTAKLAGMNDQARRLLRAVSDRLSRTDQIERGLLQEEDYYDSDEEEKERSDLHQNLGGNDDSPGNRQKVEEKNVVNQGDGSKISSSSSGAGYSGLLKKGWSKKKIPSDETTNSGKEQPHHQAQSQSTVEPYQDEELRELPPVPKPIVVVRPGYVSPKKRPSQQVQPSVVSPPHPALHVPIHKHIRLDSSAGHSEGQAMHSARLRDHTQHRRPFHQSNAVAPNVFTQAMNTSFGVSGLVSPLIHNQDESSASRHRVKNAMRARKAHNIISSSNSSSGNTKIVI